MANFDAETFARWMQENYSKDKYGNYENFAKIIKSNPATISRLMTAKKQTLTDKPSQPKRDLVIRLAEEFNKDIDEALLLAGYAPKESMVAETAELDENVRVQLLGAKHFTEEDKREYMEAFQVAYEVAKRRIAERKKQTE